MRAVISPLLCVAVTALFWPRIAYPALPPASTGSTRETSDAASAPGQTRGADGALDKDAPWEIPWVLPVIRVGGSLSYNTSRSSAENQNTTQQALMATLRAATDTYIWQPWFSQLNGNIAATFSRDSSDSTAAYFGSDSKTRSVAFTGYGQLKLLPTSRFPFELHFDKSDSRISGNLVSVEGYSGQRIGFTQQYLRPTGDLTVGWDRATQDSETNGRDRQDTLRLNLSHNLEQHRFTFNGDWTENTRRRTGESTSQNNVTIQHSYVPLSSVNVENMANVSQSEYRLGGGQSESEIGQLSTIIFWRPDEQPMTVTGSARVLTMEGKSGGNEYGSTAGVSSRNLNLNLGMTYDLSRHTRFNASANANASEMAGRRVTGTNQTAGVHYQPDAKSLGEYRYTWTTSGTLSNSTGGNRAGAQLSLQLSHSLSRYIRLSEGSGLTMEVSQGVTGVNEIRSRNDDSNIEPSATRHVTHGGALSWSLSDNGGSAMVRLSASDSRALDGNEAFFQLINLQASSNLPTSGYTSWSGSLTVQAVRQGGNRIIGTMASGNTEFMRTNQADDGFVTTSSGTVTYQNTRLFGIRRLRFVSDLRLNSQALLPMLGGPQDQEMAAWENRLDYWIGRTQLRLDTLVAQITTPNYVFSRGGATAPAESKKSVTKSIMFSVTRSFGDM